MVQLLLAVAGDSSNIAYLANVCVSEAARRCRIGEALMQHARQLAQSWGETGNVAGLQLVLLQLHVQPVPDLM
jgi:ribosomal protein S18 acetylase RimI-like enzyme